MAAFNDDGGLFGAPLDFDPFTPADTPAPAAPQKRRLWGLMWPKEPETVTPEPPSRRQIMERDSGLFGDPLDHDPFAPPATAPAPSRPSGVRMPVEADPFPGRNDPLVQQATAYLKERGVEMDEPARKPQRPLREQMDAVRAPEGEIEIYGIEGGGPVENRRNVQDNPVKPLAAAGHNPGGASIPVDADPVPGLLRGLRPPDGVDSVDIPGIGLVSKAFITEQWKNDPVFKNKSSLSTEDLKTMLLIPGGDEQAKRTHTKGLSKVDNAADELELMKEYANGNPELLKDLMSGKRKLPYALWEAQERERQTPTGNSGFLRRTVGDAGVKLAQGAVTIPEAVVGLGDLYVKTAGAATGLDVDGVSLGKTLQDTGVDLAKAKEWIGKARSPNLQRAEMTVAEAEGFFGTLNALRKNPSAAVASVMESLPLMYAGGLTARTLMKVAPGLSRVVASAMGEGISASGASMEGARQGREGGVATGADAVAAAATAVTTTLFTLLGGKVSEKIGLTDVDTLMAGGSRHAKVNVISRAIQRSLDDVAPKTAKVLSKGGSLAAAFISEGVLEEFPQEVSEAIFGNLANGRPWDEGVAEAGAAAIVAGGLMGSGGNVFSGNIFRRVAELDRQAHPRQRFLRGLQEGWHKERKAQRFVVQMPAEGATGAASTPVEKPQSPLFDVIPEHAAIAEFMASLKTRPVDVTTGKPLAGPDEQNELARFKAMPQWQQYLNEADGDEMLAMFALRHDQQADAEADQAAAEQEARAVEGLQTEDRRPQTEDNLDMGQEVAGEQDIQARQTKPEDVAAPGDGAPVQAQMPVSGMPGGAADQQQAGIATGRPADAAENAVGEGERLQTADRRPQTEDNLDMGQGTAAAGQSVEVTPSEAQKEAGNYKKAHVRLDGHDISIENPVGTERSGTDEDGKTWHQPMAADYGYIRGTRGFDKDHLDVFIKPGYTGGAGKVHVVNQVNPRSGKFDEHKVVFGAADQQEAAAIYQANYEPGWQGGKNVVEMSAAEFKQWIAQGGPANGELSTPQETPVGKMTPAAVRAELHRFGVHELRGDDGKMRDIEDVKSPIALRKRLAAERANLENRRKLEAAAQAKSEKKAAQRKTALSSDKPRGGFKSNVTYKQDNRVTPLINEINRLGGMRKPEWTNPGKAARELRKLVDGNYDGIIDDGRKVAVPAFMGVFSKNGQFTPDQMVELLSRKSGRDQERGHLPAGSSIDEMWRIIRDEVADYSRWRSSDELPANAIIEDADELVEHIRSQEDAHWDALQQDYDEAVAELEAALEDGSIVAQGSDVAVDGLGDDGETFRVERVYVDENLQTRYALISNVTGEVHDLENDSSLQDRMQTLEDREREMSKMLQTLGQHDADEADYLDHLIDVDSTTGAEYDIDEWGNEYEQRDSDSGRQEAQRASPALPGQGLQGRPGNARGRTSTQRGEREASTGEAGEVPAGTGRLSPAAPVPGVGQQEGLKPAESLFGADEPFNLTGDTAADGARIQKERDAQREKERKAKAAAADMSLLGDDPTGTEQAVFYSHPVTNEKTKAIDAQGWRIWLKQQPGTLKQRADRLMMFDALYEGRDGGPAAIAFAAKLAGISPVAAPEAQERGAETPSRPDAAASAATAAAGDYKPVMTANSPIPAGLTYEQFKAEYENALKQGFKYTPKQAGFDMWSEQMANLADAYPEFEKRIDAEADAPKPLRFGGDLLGPTELPKGDGWTESRPGGLATSKNPVRGGIVDQAIFSKKWLAIPSSENPNFEKIKAALGNNEFDSRGEAFQALYAAVEQAGSALANESDQSNIRTMDEDGRVSDGKGGIQPGDVFRTSSGRTTTPYPKYSTKRITKPDQIKMNNWLIENAKAEAAARGDDFNVTQFSAMSALNFSPADGDAASMYLFGEQPEVQSPVLKPMVGKGTKDAAAHIFQPWQDVLEAVADRDLVQGTLENAPHNLRILLKKEIKDAYGDWMLPIVEEWDNPDYAQARAFIQDADKDLDANLDKWIDWTMKYLGAEKAEAQQPAKAPAVASGESAALDQNRLSPEQQERYESRYFIRNWVLDKSSSYDREAIIGKPYFFTQRDGRNVIDKTPRFATASEAFAWLEQNRPVNAAKPQQQQPAPAPKPRAKVEVKAPTLNLSDEKQAQLKAIQDKLRANLKGRLGMNPMLDPENVSLAAQMANLYVEGGVKTFKQFAHNVSVDMADAWDAIKVFLHGAWQSAGAVDDSLDDISRTDAREVISAIDKAAAAGGVQDLQDSRALKAGSIIEITHPNTNATIRVNVFRVTDKAVTVISPDNREMDIPHADLQGNWRQVDNLKNPISDVPAGGRSLNDYIAQLTAIANAAVLPDLALRELINSRDSNQAKSVRMRQMATAEGITLKQLQERIEFELVKMADEIASRADLDTAAKYKALVELYENQPLLTARTSTSIENQAYSTPAPLAFISSYMAAADQAASVYEPTGGNGMLLIGLDKAKVTANELDPARAANLRTLAVPTVTTDDATAKEPGGPYASIVMNPPFGSFPTTNVDGYAIKKIEHVIALQALRGLAADGRSVMILGANREPGEIGQGADRTFLNYLHNHFNVADHFEIDGDLYGKQGAKWPLRVIVLDGRRQDVPSVPQDLAPKSVDRLASWDDIYTRAKEVRDEIEKRRDNLDADGKIGPDVRPEAQQPATEDAGAVPGQPGRNPAKAGGRGGRGGSTRGTIPPRRKPAIRSSDDSASGTPDEQDLFSPRPNDRTSAPGGRGSSDKGMDNQREGRDQQPADADGRPGDRAGTGDRVEPRDLPRGTSLLGQPQNAGQHRYVPASDATSLETLVPSNMAPGIAGALEKLRDKVGGDIDEWVRFKLGYDTIADLHRAMAAEQVDGVALAIDQIENGGALIIADETGIGKGRQAAGIMRYAQQNGIIPVFFTKDAKLFSDLQRDANDVGYSFNPFILGATDGGADVVDETGRVLFKAPKSAGARRTAINSIIDKGIAAQKFDTVIATYPQINKQNEQQHLLTHLSRNEKVLIIMDEAHEASGSDSMQGAFFRGGEVKRGSGANRTTTLLPGILTGRGVKGVVYLSATYAKRPDNAPLYFRTLLGRAADNINDLVEAMSRGGVALQQAVAEALSSVGQLVRRERDFSGVVFERKIVQQERATELASKVDDTTSIFRDIKLFSNMVRIAIKQENGPGARATAMTDAQVDYTPFASIAHNYISQMLLATKVDAVVEEAVAAHQRGEKPVIALMNTQESMMDQFAEQNGWRVGDAVSMDFRDMLRRALDRTLRFSVKDPQGKPETFTTTAGELGLQEFYDRIIEQINDLEVDIPTSPIDAILQGLRAKGLRVGELTGRQSGIRYADSSYNSGIYERRQKADKNALVNGFNNGDLDALILNASGSTGLSIHASPKFKERPIKTRNMIIAQPHGDINVMVQTLGRIKRTGMIPGGAKYSMPVLPLEAERRPAMVLERKMKSLNANTTAAQEGGVSLDQVDFMNRYGDQIVAQYMFEDNPALQDMLDMSPEVNERTGTVTPDREDFANVFAGRMALMPNRVQKDAYAAIIQRYNDYIAYLKATDQYELEIAVHDDWDGVMISEETLRPGTSEANIFEADTKIQRWEIKDTRHVPTAKEMQKDFEERSGSAEAMQERIAGFVEQVETAYSKIIDESETTLANPDITLSELSTVRKRLDQARNGSAIFQTRVAPVLLSIQRWAGEFSSITNEQEGIDAIGMITGITFPEQPADRVKSSPGSIVLHIMTNQPGGHSLRVPLSQVGDGGFSIGHAYADENQVDVHQTGGRFERQVISGNPIRAINAAGNRGRLVSFKTRDGKTVTGLLMPLTWTPSQLARDPRRDLVDGAAVRLWLDTERSGVESDVVRLTPRGYTRQISISVPTARATGSKYFLDDQIRAITGDFDRVGNRMIARVDVDQIPAIADRVSVLSKARFRPSPGNMPDNMAIERVREINGRVSGTTAQAARGAASTAAGIARAEFDSTMQAESARTPWASENAEAVESLDALPAPVRQAIARGEGQAARSSVAQDKLGFYSALARSVERMDFKAMPAKALINRLEGAQKKGEFKLDEYEEIGLGDWLKGIEGKVTKEQVLAFIEQGGPKLEEVVKGEVSDSDVAAWWNDEGGANEETPYYDLSPAEQGEAVSRYQEEVQQYAEDGGTKFGQYQLPGGENYREVLIKLPVSADTAPRFTDWMRDKGYRIQDRQQHVAEYQREFPPASQTQFTSSHWSGDPNVLVHMRLNDRTDAAGRKTLFIEEIQSDWHQKGRGKGYNTPEMQQEIALQKAEILKGADAAELEARQMAARIEARDEYAAQHQADTDFDSYEHTQETNRMRREMRELFGKSQTFKGQAADIENVKRLQLVPDAPFKRTPAWSMLAFKRVLRMAAEQGYERVAWTPGEVQNERYSLAKQVDSITVLEHAYEPGTYTVTAFKDGQEIINKPADSQAELSDIIGKELSKNAIESIERTKKNPVPYYATKISGEDLEIGGEGMKGFYDKILPTEVDKYLKKLDKDATVGRGRLDLKGEYNIDALYNDAREVIARRATLTPEIEAHFDAFVESNGRDAAAVEGINDALETVDADFIVGRNEGQDTQVWSIPVTEKMRATILNEGQARFRVDGAGQVRAVTMGQKSWFILDRYNNTDELSGDIHEEAFHRIENEYADPARTRRLGVATYGGKWLSIAQEIEKNYGFKPGTVDFFREMAAKAYRDGQTNRSIWGRFVDAIVATIRRIGRAAGMKLTANDAELRSYVNDVLARREAGAQTAPAADALLFARSSVKPWSKDFPKSFSHTTVGKVTGHTDFKAAKAGDMEAARRLVRDVMKGDRVREVARQFPGAIVVPVVEKEDSGVNAIPIAIAEAYAKAGMKLDRNIWQDSTIKRKGLDAVGRLTARKAFEGKVVKAGKYLLVDDVLTQGGTIHELRHHIANNGGEAVGVVSLAFSAGSNVISIQDKTLTDLIGRFGRGNLESILREYNIAGTVEALTESEAKAIGRFATLDAFRKRLSASDAGQVDRGYSSPQSAYRGSLEISQADRQLYLIREGVPSEKSADALKAIEAALNPKPAQLDLFSGDPLNAPVAKAGVQQLSGQKLAQPPVAPARSSLKIPPQKLKAILARTDAEREAWYNNRWKEAFAAVGEGRPVMRIIPEMLQSDTPIAMPVDGMKIESAADIHALMTVLRTPYFESMKALWLDSKRVAIRMDILSIGSHDSSLVHPAMLLRKIPKGARSVILSHNHPSGDPSPSKEDNQITTQLVEAMSNAGIAVVDHVVTNGMRFFSFREAGLLTPKEAAMPYNGYQSPVTRSVRPVPKPITKADWEIVESDPQNMQLWYLWKFSTPMEVADIVNRFADGTPYIHVLYLNTRMVTVAVERMSPDITALEASQRLQKNGAEAGAAAIVLHVPTVNGPTSHVLQWGRTVIDVLKKTDISILDIITPAQGTASKYFSTRDTGYLQFSEPATPYGSSVNEPAESYGKPGPVEVRPGVFRTEDPNDVPDGAPFLSMVKTENGDNAWEFKPPAHLDKTPAEAEFEKEKAETMWNQAMDLTMASIGGLQRHGARWKATDKQISEYRRNNPKSSWDDVYANVPSRYKSAAAMAEAHIRDYNQRPNITWVDLLASTIHHYGEKVPGLRRMVESTSRWMDNKFLFESLIFNQGADGRGDSDLEAVRKFTTKGRPKLKALSSWENPEWVRLVKYLYTRDMNAKSYRAAEDERHGGWMVFGLDGKPVKQGGALQDNYTFEHQAWEAAHQLEAADLQKEGYSQEAAEMLLAVRRINDRAYEQIRGEVQTAQDELDDLGLPMPKVKKANGEMGDLWDALREMGDRRGYYMPRMRRSGKFKLSAVRTSDGARFLQLFDTGLMRWTKMRQLQRQGYDQFSQSISDRPSETSYMDVSVLALNDQLQKALDKIKKTEKESRGLESINISSRWEDYKTLNGKTEKHFVIEGGVTSKQQHRILKDAGGKYMTLDDSPKEWRFINPKGDIEKRLVNALLRHEITKMQVSSFAETITENIADLIHQRGSRSHKIARDDSTGKEVWQGYEPDALKAITLSGKSIAGGTAKRLLAKEFMRAITGQTETWRQYRMRRMNAFIAENTASRVTADDIDAAAVDWYHDYADEVARNRIDSATQGNAYDEAVSYAREMLRNETRSERVIGTLKGLTATKYMSSLFSGLVNFTSLVTHSGPSMSAFADIPMLKSGKLLTRSASDYVRWAIHQKTGKGQGLDAEGAELFNEIHARGWDSSQIHHEALAVLQRRSGMLMQKFTESHLLAYSVVERLVRMSTIAATYRGIREQHKGEWTAKDNEAALNKGLYVSNKANSVFGKTNLPAWTRGPSVGAQTLRSMYMFQSFAHNTYLIMKEIGVDKKNYSALAWMLVAPALLAGPKAFIPRPLVVLLAKMVFKAFGLEPPEDPEEEYYQWIEEYFSEQLGGFAGRTAGRTARYGLLGAANINISGSLGVRTFELDKWYDWFGAPGSAVLDYIKAGEYAAEGNALKAAETLLPRFEANFVKAYREASEGLTGQNNMPLFDGDKPRKATTGETILRAAGANPASISAMRETQWADRKIESEYSAMRAEISARYRKWLLAPKEQRSEKEKDNIAKEIEAYNKRVTDKGLGAYGNVPYYDNRSINAVERSMVRPPKRELIRAARRAAAEDNRD